MLRIQPELEQIRKQRVERAGEEPGTTYSYYENPQAGARAQELGRQFSDLQKQLSAAEIQRPKPGVFEFTVGPEGGVFEAKAGQSGLTDATMRPMTREEQLEATTPWWRKQLKPGQSMAGVDAETWNALDENQRKGLYRGVVYRSLGIGQDAGAGLRNRNGMLKQGPLGSIIGQMTSIPGSFEKLFTDPTKLNLGDFANLSGPVGWAGKWAVENPRDALAVGGAALTAGMGASLMSPLVGGAAAPGAAFSGGLGAIFGSPQGGWRNMLRQYAESKAKDQAYNTISEQLRQRDEARSRPRPAPQPQPQQNPLLQLLKAQALRQMQQRAGARAGVPPQVSSLLASLAARRR